MRWTFLRCVAVPPFFSRTSCSGRLASSGRSSPEMIPLERPRGWGRRRSPRCGDFSGLGHFTRSFDPSRAAWEKPSSFSPRSVCCSSPRGASLDASSPTWRSTPRTYASCATGISRRNRADSAACCSATRSPSRSFRETAPGAYAGICTLGATRLAASSSVLTSSFVSWRTAEMAPSSIPVPSASARSSCTFSTSRRSSSSVI